jgi:hypothetical protein
MDMTHIAEARVIDNHAQMDGSSPAASLIPPTVGDILRAGVRRRARRSEMVAAQSTWDSEGGGIGEGESRPHGREDRAPRGLGG